MQRIAPGVEIDGWLGTGAMGTVYGGRWTVDGVGRDVAVKLSRGGEGVLADARPLLGLDHPNLVAVHACGWTTAPWDEFADGTAYVVLQRVAAQNLTEWGGAGEDVARTAVAQLLGVLACVHARGVLHGDISPGNVLGSADRSHFWLTDFGGAGTEGFTAPERRDGPTIATDLYSVGALGRFLGGGGWLDALVAADPGQRPASASAAAQLVAIQ